jgi:tetratricopeptide (TPR) repeat protein
MRITSEIVPRPPPPRLLAPDFICQLADPDLQGPAMTDDVAAFETQLCACRRSAGLSQEELADRSGLSIRAIANLEHGRTRWPHPDSVRRLADALELRGQARGEFFAAAGRRLAGEMLASAVVAPEGRLGPASDRQVVPRQLPVPVRQFVGRERELATLTDLLDQAGTTSAVVISAIGGTAGVGKTALAVYWAHQVASRFPDGQLYVNLRGFDPSGRPVPPTEAIRGLLDALLVPAEQIPAALDAQAGLYRSLLSGRHMLVVLDNARDAEQVRPLLPGSLGCLVVVTSRSQLAGLVAAEGACSLTLGLLAEAEAHELLARRLGPARLAAEPGAVAELIGLCARLPLALAIVTARALGRPGLRLDALAEELQDACGRLDGLETGDAAASLRAVFSWSIGSLSAQAVRMFRLLGLYPGPDITIPAAASLAGIPLPQARRTVRELDEAHMITEHVPGRLTLHDLLRAYAAEQAATADDAARNAAVIRVLDHYLHTAHAAACLLNPSREPVTLSPLQPGVTPEHLADYRQALAWFEAEHHVLISAITLAARTGYDICAWQLPWALADYLDWRGQWHESAAIKRTALAAATRLGDTAVRAETCRQLANAYAKLADYDQARGHLTECLALFEHLGDRSGEARVYQALGWVAGRQGRYAEALGYDQQALDVFQATTDRAGQATALNSVGWYHILLGDAQRARAFCQQAIALYRETGDLAGQAHAWDSLGYAEYKLGRLDHAAACYQHALSTFRDLGDRFYEADTVARLGDAREAAADLAGARDAWQQALNILHDLQHPNAAPLRAKLKQLGQARQSMTNATPTM